MQCDLLVVGGGINGAGIAREAALRGLKVVLCEQNDLASHTSSASTKLIHGGLRYLEHGEFSLVRKALAEREVLLNIAPHIIWPMRFVLPHEPHLRPAWMIRLGLFFYDYLARRRSLPGSNAVSLANHVTGEPLKERRRKAFLYSDAWVDDARLVVLNALDAAEHQAQILPRTRCTGIRREGAYWLADLVGVDGVQRSVQARAVVNATGPWAASFIQSQTPVLPQHAIRLVKGSHIVVPRLFTHPYSYIFQNADRRVIFVIPYEDEFTLVGTTDIEHRGAPEDVRIGEEEVVYLCEVVNRNFVRQITPADVVHSYAGLRPLLEDESDDPSSVTRDYTFELSSEGAPLLSVIGGKITTYRRLAQEAMDRLAPLLASPVGGDRSQSALPGGDIPQADFDAFVTNLKSDYPKLCPQLLKRWAHAYGTRIQTLLAGVRCTEDLGEPVLPGLYRVELDYLRTVEWATCAEDVLWRRSKLGLHLPPDATAVLDAWLVAHPLKS